MSTIHSGSRADYPQWMTPLLGLLLACLGALLCDVAHLYLVVPAGVGVIGAAIRMYYARRRYTKIQPVAFLSGCWLVPGVWASCTAWLPFSWLNLGCFALVCVVAALFADVIVSESVRPVVQQQPFQHPEAVRLRDLLDELFGSDTTNGLGWSVTKFKMWPGKAGYTARIKPHRSSRITLTKVKGVVDEMAALLPLREGCTIRVGQAEHHGAFIIEVMLVNMLAEDRTYPSRCGKGTILDHKTVGWFADGKPLQLDLHQNSTLAVAMRGGGKTVLMHIIIAELLQCTDTLIAVIDMNGAGLAVPWMRPYALGEVAEPPIQFVANGEDAALEAAAMFVTMALERKSAYAALMAEQDTDVLPVSPEIPHWTVIIDEGGEIFGGDVPKKRLEAGRRFLELQRIGRAACVNVIFTSQRGTSDYITAALKKAAYNRLLGPVQDDNELGHVLDFNHGIRYSDLTGPGQWFARLGTSTPRKAKSYRLLPSQIGAIARAVQPWRPTCDPASARAGGRVWTDRFVKLAPWLRAIASTDYDPDAGPVVDVEELLGRPVTAQDDGYARADQYIAELRAQVDDAGRIANNAQPEQPEAPDGQEPDWVRSYMDQLDQVDVLAEPRNTTTVTVDPDVEGLGKGQAFTYALVCAAGAGGIRTQDIYTAANAEGLVGDRRATVNNWLAELRKRSLVEPLKSGLWVVTDPRGQTDE